jgi:hypothetical protein
MAPFDENNIDDADHSGQAFWDWYVIGGRWSGTKLQDRLGRERIATFNRELEAMKVTVSAVQVGKPELSPSDQLPKVDEAWRRNFPDAKIDYCPFFRRDRAKEELIPYDVCLLGECPRVTAERIIIAGCRTDGTLYPAHMMEMRYWNGVTYVDTSWDGDVLVAISAYIVSRKNSTDDWKDRNLPRGDWLVVTVDYHS